MKKLHTTTYLRHMVHSKYVFIKYFMYSMSCSVNSFGVSLYFFLFCFLGLLLYLRVVDFCLLCMALSASFGSFMQCLVSWTGTQKCQRMARQIVVTLYYSLWSCINRTNSHEFSHHHSLTKQTHCSLSKFNIILHTTMSTYQKQQQKCGEKKTSGATNPQIYSTPKALTSPVDNFVRHRTKLNWRQFNTPTTHTYVHGLPHVVLGVRTGSLQSMSVIPVVYYDDGARWPLHVVKWVSTVNILYHQFKFTETHVSWWH